MEVSREKLENYISRFGKISTCPVCGSGKWRAADKLFMLNEYNEGQLILGGPTLPVLPIVCESCGTTLFINAFVSGILEQKHNENQHGGVNDNA